MRLKYEPSSEQAAPLGARDGLDGQHHRQGGGFAVLHLDAAERRAGLLPHL